MTIDRATPSRISRQSSMTISRGTVRDFEDDHLVQEVTGVDVFHSETATNKGAPLERFQMVGMTAVPLKQHEEEGGQQQAQQGQASQDGTEWNHQQPKGPAAEALMLYLNGSRAHPVAMVDDRRVRPYGMSEGEGAHYAPDGSEQMVLFKETGTYLVSLDGPDLKKSGGASAGQQAAQSGGQQQKKTRFVSMRHVEKEMQTHKIEKKQQSQQGGGASAAQQAATGGQQQKEKYKHEGKTVNTEVRCTKDRIEFRAGDKVFGYFEKSSEKWNFNGKTAEHDFSGDFTRKANNIKDKPQSKYELEEGANSPVEGQNLDLSSKVFIKKGAEDITLATNQQLSVLEQRIAELEARIVALES
jgi:phage gp45-like